MDYKQFVSKNVKIVQVDGFTRRGFVKAVEDEHLILLFEDKIQFVRKDFIGVIQEERKK